nr:hypothetical protein [Pandoravirus aubagnensis]
MRIFLANTFLTHPLVFLHFFLFKKVGGKCQFFKMSFSNGVDFIVRLVSTIPWAIQKAQSLCVGQAFPQSQHQTRVQRQKTRPTTTTSDNHALDLTEREA